MRITRRRFLRSVTATGIGVALLTIASVPGAHAFNQSPQIPLFKTTLRGVGPGQIPVAAPGPLPGAR